MLPTVEPASQNVASAPAQQSMPSMPAQQSSAANEEILGNTDDPALRFSCASLPSRSSLTSPGGLPFGFILQPHALPEESNRWLRREPSRCEGCGVFRNLYVAVERGTGRWMCNFCDKVNKSDDLSAPDAVDTCRELRDAVVEYAEATPGSFQMAQTPTRTHVFVIDATIRAKDMPELQEAVAEAAAALPPSDSVGLVVFDGVIRVYDMSRSDVASAQVLAGYKSPAAHELNALGASGAVLAAPVHACASVLMAIVKSVKPPVRIGGRDRAKQRCLGPAIETAVAITASSQGASVENQGEGGKEGVSPVGGRGRVAVLIGGGATVGPGRLQVEGDEEGGDEAGMDPAAYWQLVGERARRLGVSVDVFAVSLTKVGVDKLQAMTTGSGGELVSHQAFSGAMVQDLCTAQTRSLGSSGVFNVHASAGVEVTRILGPLIPPATRAEVEMSEDLPNLSISPAVEARHAITVMFHLTEDPPDEYVYFQAVWAYTTKSKERVIRTSTSRLPVTKNTADMLQSIDAGTVGVLLAKEAVVSVRERGVSVEDAKQELSVQLQNIARTWSDQVKVGVTGRVPVVPSQLSLLPKLVFQASTGPLLGSLLNDEDDYDVIRQLFLNSGVDDAIRLLNPPFFSVSLDPENPQYSGVGLDDVSLAGDRLLLLDHHTNIFLWSGAQVAGAEHDVVRARVLSDFRGWTSGRFPAPEVMAFGEGDSMARWLVARLNPAHRDAAPQGLVGSMAGAVRSMLQTHFSPTDDDSFLQWMARIRVALPDQ